MVNSAADADTKLSAKMSAKMIQSINDGRASVTEAVNKVNSLSNDFAAAKNAIAQLKEKYDVYYNYACKGNSIDRSNCNIHYLACEQALRSLTSNQYTAAYTANDKSLAAKSMSKSALAIADSVYSKYYALRGSFSNTSLNYAETAYNALATSMNDYLFAIESVYQVRAYSILLNEDSTIKYNYDNLYKTLKVYINICDYVGDYDKFYANAY